MLKVVKSIKIIYNKEYREGEQIMKTFLRKIKNIFFGNSVAQRLFQGYLIAMLIGALLLVLPFSCAEGAEKVNFIDALFISASACSDTGLTTLQLSSQFSFFGQLVIILLVQIGGIGILTLKIMFLLFLGKKIKLKERLFGASERGSGKLGGSVDLIKTSLAVLFITEFVAAILMMIRFLTVPEYREMFPSTGKLIWTAIFHSISATNNAGFDIFPGGTSLVVFKGDYFIQIVTMLCLIIGGIGFPIFYDIKNYFKAKRKKEFYQVSLFTKFSLKSYFIVGFSGFILVVISELLAPTSSGLLYSQDFTVMEKIFALIFQTTSARNAGFATVDLNILQPSTNLLLTILMCIGASPSSTGGGLRCTTFLLVVYLIKSVATGTDRVEIYNRSVPKNTVNKALGVFIATLFVVVGSSLLLLMVNSDNSIFTIEAVLLEVGSAFGTTGLSLGITYHLNVLSKIILIFVMFIGYVGISTSLLVWSDKKVVKNLRELPEEDITIG